MIHKKLHIKFALWPWVLTAFFFLSSTNNVLAEGSKDIYPAGVTGGRAYLYASNTPSAAFPYPSLATHYVYAEAGERIALASSAQTGRTNRIRLYGPNNYQINLSFSSGSGNIPNRSGELAGPRLPGQGSGNNRYAPIYHQVTQTGIYRVEFISTSGSETGNNRIGYVAANANWSQPSNSHYLAAWDISVAKQTGSSWSWQNGRVYTTVVNMDNPSYGGTSGNDNNNFRPNSGFYGKFKVLTRDGYVYNVDNNGNQGISFTFMVNNRGFHEPGTPDVPLYKSIQAPSEQYVRDRYHDPRIEDSGAAVTQKVFYNNPDSTMPETSNGAVPGGQTWLRIPEKDLNVNEITVKGVEGVEKQLGTKGAYIEFYNESGGDYFITIRPKPGSGTSFPERKITGSSVIGDNSIFWDGKDGNGVSLPNGISDVEIELKLRGAEVHFPYIDMELNHHGIILELLSEDFNSIRSDKVYWDDTDIRTVSSNPFGSMTSPRNASHEVISNGTSSNTNGHIWGLGSNRTEGTFGDEQGMDTWTFIEGDALITELEVNVKIADLEIPSITPNKTQLTTIGEEITYTIKAKNNGPSDVEEAPFSFIIPEGFTPEDIVFKDVNGCGAEHETLIYDANTRTYNSTLNLPNGCEVEYEVTVKVNSDITAEDHEFIATIMRPNDVTDPDATNPDPNKPPTDPFYECENNGLGGECNNIKNSSIEFMASYALEKQGAFNDENGDGFAQPGERITYTFTVKNTSAFDIHNVNLDDPMMGGAITGPESGDENNDGILNIDEEWVYSVEYIVTQNDVNENGVYNLATVSGETESGDPLLPETSVDPNPLDPSNSNYDPTRPDHTFVPLPTSELICTEEISGEAFQWSYSGGEGVVTETMTQPGANGGFQFDIYELDNSFNMEINGVLLAAHEIEFQSSGTPPPGINIEFEDGDQYETDTEGDIWEMTGTAERPLIRVTISPTGEVKMFGSKSSGGVLHPLQFKQNVTPINSFNIIPWNVNSDNTIIVTQNIVGATLMDGYGSGRNIIPCETYTLEKEGVFNDENGDGIAQVGETITYTLTVKNKGDIDIYDLEVTDPMLGGVITTTPTGDENNDGVLNIYEEWVYTVAYEVTQEDIDNKGVYNLATVSGINEKDEPLVPATSVDPEPLDPNDPMYDPERPDHTFVPLIGKGSGLLITNPNIYNRVKSN